MDKQQSHLVKINTDVLEFESRICLHHMPARVFKCGMHSSSKQRFVLSLLLKQNAMFGCGLYQMFSQKLCKPFESTMLGFVQPEICTPVYIVFEQESVVLL
jgi:hypothetical protein